MKRTFAIFLSIAALLLAAAPLAGQEYPYKGGEKLSYTVHYKCGISADLAYVDLACTEDASSFSVKANVATYKFWDTFFKMRDTFETKFAKTGNRPISYHRDVTEGGYWARNWLTWSADASQYRSITEKKTRPRRDTVYRESEIVYDVINLIYKATYIFRVSYNNYTFIFFFNKSLFFNLFFLSFFLFGLFVNCNDRSFNLCNRKICCLSSPQE